MLWDCFWTKQRRSSYYFSKFLAVLHAFARPADLKNPREEGTKVDRTVSGVTSIEGQLVNSRALDIAIYLRTYLRANSLRACARLWSSTRIAATRLAWTTVILNSSETTSGPLSNGRALKISVYKISKRGVRANLLEPPPTYGLDV